jgi:hypothetical protein
MFNPLWQIYNNVVEQSEKSATLGFGDSGVHEVLEGIGYLIAGVRIVVVFADGEVKEANFGGENMAGGSDMATCILKS